jgi:hypothetical protein
MSTRYRTTHPATTTQAGSRWRSRAACRDVDPELFFPTAAPGTHPHTTQVRRAKAVCGRCPVRRDCLTDALTRIPYGVAGGLTEDERRNLRRGGR